MAPHVRVDIGRGAAEGEGMRVSTTIKQPHARWSIEQTCTPTHLHNCKPRRPCTNMNVNNDGGENSNHNTSA